MGDGADRSSSPFGGANPRGWVASFNDLGIGPYDLVSLPSFDEAITTAAAAHPRNAGDRSAW